MYSNWLMHIRLKTRGLPVRAAWNSGVGPAIWTSHLCNSARAPSCLHQAETVFSARARRAPVSSRQHLAAQRWEHAMTPCMRSLAVCACGALDRL